MSRVQFILELRKRGYTDKFIGEALAWRERDRANGIVRRWEEYLPGCGRKSG